MSITPQNMKSTKKKEKNRRSVSVFSPEKSLYHLG
jgi:hypothetical protein